MTREQLKALPFEFKSHLSLDLYYTTRYVYNCEKYSIIWDKVTQREDVFTLGDTQNEFVLIVNNEIVYEGTDENELVDAITEVEKSKASDNY